jgi:2-oxo-hept-3-ene-1,7-dioate hydratase
MLDEALIEKLAQELENAEVSRTQLEHFSKHNPAMTIEDGYRINRAWMKIKAAQGRQVIGHKIGLTSRAMQVSSNIDEPDYGTLLDTMRHVCKAGEVLEIPVMNFIAPRVEVELAFILRRELRGPNITVQDVMAATDYVTPAVEIIDARIEQFDRYTKAPRKVFDTISDNAANAGIVVGDITSDSRYRIDAQSADLPWVGAICRYNGVVEETGLAAGVQGHPAVGIAWLANKLAPWGEHLHVGEIVLAGSFTKPVPAKAGDVFDVDYGAHGCLKFKFV